MSATIARLEAEIAAEQARIDALIADAVANHGTMPDDYWKPLAALRRRLHLYRAISPGVLDAVRSAMAEGTG